MGDLQKKKIMAILIYLTVVIIFASALVDGLNNYTEIQRTEVGFNAILNDLLIESDANNVNLTGRVTFSNPSNRDVNLYNVAINIDIYNSTVKERISIGLFTGKAFIKANQDVTLNMKLKIPVNTDNLVLQHALWTMQFGKPGVERTWILYGAGDYYVNPYNFYYQVLIQEVVRK